MLAYCKVIDKDMLKNLFSKAKNAMIGKLMDKQLKNLPPEQREAIKAAILKNPTLFEKIAKEVEGLKKQGIPEMAASMKVMQKYKGELAKALQN